MLKGASNDGLLWRRNPAFLTTLLPRNSQFPHNHLGCLNLGAVHQELAEGSCRWERGTREGEQEWEMEESGPATTLIFLTTSCFRWRQERWGQERK